MDALMHLPCLVAYGITTPLGVEHTTGAQNACSYCNDAIRVALWVVGTLCNLADALALVAASCWTASERTLGKLTYSECMRTATT